jgi:apolipoprotein D and lipocalin family protein
MEFTQRKFMKNIFFALGFLLSIQAHAMGKNSKPPVETVPSVDLERYLGKWYEIATIPQSFQKQCTGNVTAEYAMVEDGKISVINSCDTANGKRSIATGRAKVVDTNTNSKLKVTFVNIFGWQFLFGGDYWIIGLGQNYSYAVVGAPGRDYAWILSRFPDMHMDQLVEASQVLTKQGFDTCSLITTIQTSGLQTKTPLCKVVTEDMSNPAL